MTSYFLLKSMPQILLDRSHTVALKICEKQLTCSVFWDFLFWSRDSQNMVVSRTTQRNVKWNTLVKKG